MCIFKKILKKFGFNFVNDLIKNNDLENIKKINNLNLKTSDYLINSIKYNNNDIIDYFLSIGGHKHIKYNTIIADAILDKADNDIIIRLLNKLENFKDDVLSFDFSYNDRRWWKISILQAIIETNNLELLTYLLEKETLDLNKKINTEWSFIMYCIENNNIIIFDILLKNGAVFFDNKLNNLKFVFSNQINFLEHLLNYNDITWNYKQLTFLEKKINNNFGRLNLKIIKDILNFFATNNYQLKEEV